MKRLFSKLMACVITIATALCCTLSAGCGGGGNAKPDFVMPEGGFDTNKTIEITFYHSMGANLKGILEDYIKEFNKLFPNIKVTNTSQGRYDGVRDKIEKEIIAGTQPNIAYCYPDHVALYNNANAVLPLNDFLPGGAYADMTVKTATGEDMPLALTAEEKAQFNPNFYNEGYQFGDGSKMYSMPWARSTEVMYYNKDYFEDKGYTAPTTWEELGDLCARIKADEGSDVFPFTYDSDSNWFITLCEQYGAPYTSATGTKYLFDNPKTREFMTMLQGWAQQGYFTTQMLNNNTYTSGLFTEKKSFMCIGSSGGASYQTDTSSDVEGAIFDVEIAPIPQVDPANPKAISQGPSVCILKNEDPQEVLASWLFVKFFTTNLAFQAEFSSISGYMPVLSMDVMSTNKAYMDYLEKANGSNFLTALATKVAMNNADSYFVSPAFIGSSEARDQVGALLAAVCNSAKSIDEAFSDAIGQCEFKYPSR